MTAYDVLKWFVTDPKGVLALCVALPVLVFFLLNAADVALMAWSDRRRS